jgi:hypothetical protein
MPRTVDLDEFGRQEHAEALPRLELLVTAIVLELTPAVVKEIHEWSKAPDREPSGALAEHATLDALHRRARELRSRIMQRLDGSSVRRRTHGVRRQSHRPHALLRPSRFAHVLPSEPRNIARNLT